MSDKPSPALRLVFAARMHDAVADHIEQDLFAIAHKAVGRIEAGASIKAQQRQAWVNLGRPAWWRFRSAWYRDGSRSWSAAAVADFRARFEHFAERERAAALHAEAIARAASVRDTREVWLGRAEYDDLVTRIRALEAALRL